MRANTIGEVLNRLRDEFEDITISRIRLIEAEGLISPDRTESGYRKFTEDDVERLRYILRAQRDRGMSLTAIGDELAHVTAGERLPVEEDLEEPEPALSAPVAQQARLDEVLELDPPDVQLTASELGDAAGLTISQVVELCEHGVVRSKDRFDGTDLRIARVAARLIDAGLEPRHLRMFRQFADREASLIEQLASPLVRQRNPDSRRAAMDLSEQLIELGEELQRIMLIAEMRKVLRG